MRALWNFDVQELFGGYLGELLVLRHSGLVVIKLVLGQSLRMAIDRFRHFLKGFEARVFFVSKTYVLRSWRCV